MVHNPKHQNVNLILVNIELSTHTFRQLFLSFGLDFRQFLLKKSNKSNMAHHH